MNKKHGLVLGALLTVGAVFAAPSQATIVTWDATGKINDNILFNNDDGLLGSLAPGDEFHFIFSLDNGVAATPPGSGIYSRDFPLSTASLTVASKGYSKTWDNTGNLPTVVVDAGGADSFTVNANDLFKSASLALFDTSGGPFSSNAFPSLANVKLLDNSLFTFLISNLSPLGVDGFTGTISSVSAVPLPAAAWLMLSGLGSMALVARRRKRNAAQTAAA